MLHNQYHHNAQAAAAQSTAWAVLCGLELISKKKSVGQGSWELWVESNCEFTISTAQRYMALAGNVGRAIKTALVRPGSPDVQLLTQAPSALSNSDRARLLALVTKITDGATITELYEEFGIVRRAKPAPEGGYKPSNDLVQTFLRERHPALAGTLYPALPAAIQAEFREWYTRPDGDQFQLALDYYAPVIRSLDEDASDRRWIHLPRTELVRMRDLMAARVAEIDEALQQPA